MVTPNEAYIKCRKTGQILLLYLSGNRARVVDVRAVDSSPVATDQVAGLSTSPHLQACPFCGNRRIGGCNCLKTRMVCTEGSGWYPACLYCSEMRIL